MKRLSICVALFGLVALVQPVMHLDFAGMVLGVVALLSAVATYFSARISSFLKIFVGIFAVETIVFGLAVLIGRMELWPTGFRAFLPPESLPLTVAIFAILVRAVAHLSTIQQVMRIADRYFNAEETGTARIWPFRRFTARERRIAIAMVVVLVNQAEVGVLLRLSFFNRDWFNAIQARNEPEFWRQLLQVFTPWAFMYVG